MPSNNFDGPVLIDNGLGTPGAPGGYFGFGRAPKGFVSTGPRIYAGTGNPNGTLLAPTASIYFSTSLATLYFAADAFGTWTSFATAVDIAALQAAVAVLQGQIVAINAQIVSMLAAIAANTAAISINAANLVALQTALASNSGAAMIGTSSGLTVQATLAQLLAGSGGPWIPVPVAGLGSVAIVPQIGRTHIELQGNLRTTEATDIATASLFFNADVTNAEYFFQTVSGSNGAAGVGTGNSKIITVCGSTATASALAVNILLIPWYMGNQIKQAIVNPFSAQRTASNATVGDRMMIWTVGGTAQLSAISIVLNAGSFFTSDSVLRYRVTT